MNDAVVAIDVATSLAGSRIAIPATVASYSSSQSKNVIAREIAYSYS
jgi:hypothetical protein